MDCVLLEIRQYLKCPTDPLLVRTVGHTTSNESLDPSVVVIAARRKDLQRTDVILDGQPYLLDLVAHSARRRFAQA